ncbi:MAG: hypothetical protein ABI168_05080 [Ginsengibacter sp.]
MKEITRKLKFKGSGVVLNAPDLIANEFKKEGIKISLPKVNKNENTLIFVQNKKEVTNAFQIYNNYIQPDSVFWIAYPKLSGQIKSDIHRDIIRKMAEDFGMSTVTAISIDDTWSALRLRPSEKVGI